MRDITLRRTRPPNWFEAAVVSTSKAYADRETGYLEITQSLALRYTGVIEGIPVSFAPKLVKKPSIPWAQIPESQIEILESFAAAGGVAFVLVCFERLDISGTFAVSPAWLRRVQAEEPNRRSISRLRFERGTGNAREACFETFHGEHGVPVNFAPAVWKFRGRQANGD